MTPPKHGWGSGPAHPCGRSAGADAQSPTRPLSPRSASPSLPGDALPRGRGQQSDHQSQQHQVEQHLERDQQSHAVHLRHDVSEPDGGKNGDGEVQRCGLVQGLVEGRRIADRARQVDPGEDQHVQRDEDREGLDGTKDGVLRLDDGRHLEPDDHPEHTELERQPRPVSGPPRAPGRDQEVRQQQRGHRQRHPEQQEQPQLPGVPPG